MNPAIHAALAASHEQAAGVDELVSQLRKAKALSSSTAVHLPDMVPATIDEAVGLGLVVRSVEGRLHINEHAVTDRYQSIGWIVMVVLLICASVAASVIAIIAL